MIEVLKTTILERVISQLFKEADKLIAESISITKKNETSIAIGLSLSVCALSHVVLPNSGAFVMDFVNLLITSMAVTDNNAKNISKEANHVREFFNFFNIEKENICQILKNEFSSYSLEESYFEKATIKNIIDNKILALTDEEIELFSNTRFNDKQEKYLRELIGREQEINVINFLDIVMLEASVSNKKFIQLGGKNKTLKDIVSKKNYLVMTK